MSFSSQLRNDCLQVIPLEVWTWGFQKTNQVGELVYLIITITFTWRYFQNASVPLMVFMKTYLWSEAMRELYCLFKIFALQTCCDIFFCLSLQRKYNLHMMHKCFSNSTIFNWNTLLNIFWIFVQLGTPICQGVINIGIQVPQNVNEG